jgi:hypothetical protein
VAVADMSGAEDPRQDLHIALLTACLSLAALSVTPGPPHEYASRVLRSPVALAAEENFPPGAAVLDLCNFKKLDKQFSCQG